MLVVPILIKCLTIQEGLYSLTPAMNYALHTKWPTKGREIMLLCFEEKIGCICGQQQQVPDKVSMSQPQKFDVNNNMSHDYFWIFTISGSSCTDCSLPQK